MGKILLTQSQASVVLTTALVSLFTLLLFLVGYTTQQRTVSGLQEALRPRLPQAPAPVLDQQEGNTQQPLQRSRAFRGSHVAYTDFSAAKLEDASAQVNWRRLAHLQIVRRHGDMCNAIMVLAELHRLKSPARRILLFPQAWAVEKKAGKGDISDPFMDSSRRLMRMAARRYGVELRPMSPVIQGESGGDGEGDVYSLASAYALADLDRALNLETPGLVLDASPLDAVLAFTEDAPFGMLEDKDDSDGVHMQDLFLVQPSLDLHAELKHTIANLQGGQRSFNDTDFPSFFPDHLLLSPTSSSTNLIRSIGTLHAAGDTFNATAFVKETAYIRFSDPKLPGPAYEVPWSMKRDARPANKDADWTWTKLYGQFEQKRMEVCGLGLETWRP